MSKPTELNDVVMGPPLVYRRRIAWADTDAARIAYTANFPDWGLCALDVWFREVYGVDWVVMNRDHQVGTPFVHVSMDISSSLMPGDVLEVMVLVEKLGTSSLTFRTVGSRSDGVPVFEGRYVCVHSTNDGTRMRSLPWPEERRQIIQRYVDACAALSGAVAG
ncbi:MAG: acyl-CoA thioesterase [Ectothiorhodospiraceae bacterium]|nr:acyl-CoA thioesterase [Ectothiorhodospiraceae bacterium]MCH8503750.1 acyl-CoA thioesterase [Ectothiorhodospiraceae bacterium]